MAEQSLEKRVVEQGCYSPEENARIFSKWFKQNRRSFNAVHKVFDFDEKVVCDIGCAYGGSLVKCSEESWGIELEPYLADFANSIGLKVFQADFLDDTVKFPSADAIWCADVLEHVDSPHVFLRRAHSLLSSNGLLCLKVPVIPRLHIPLPVVRRYQAGYLFDDHINGFTTQSLRFFCERAGFRTILCGLFVSPGLRWLNFPSITDLTGQCVYVGEKIDHWEYPKDSTRTASEAGIGYEFRGQDFVTPRYE